MAKEVLDILGAIVGLDKSQGDPLASSSFFVVIKGAEDLTVNITQGSLPVLKKEAMEYSSAVGVKLGASGKVQAWQQLTLTVNEKNDARVVERLNSLMLKNERFTLEYYIADARQTQTKLWGVLKYAFFTRDDNPEFDAESEEILKHSIGVQGWFKFTCGSGHTSDLINAISVVNQLKAHSGLEACDI